MNIESIEGKSSGVAGMVVRGRMGLILAVVALAGLLGLGAWRAWRAWGRRSALAEIRAQVDAGRFVAAERNLEALLAREPGCDEAAFWLGVCEKARGRGDAALAAWARVPAGSAFAAAAIRSRAATLADRGRLADAEELVERALADPRVEGDDLLRFLDALFTKEGRYDDARRAVEANWERLDRAGRGGSGPAIELIRRHLAIGREAEATGPVREFLDRAGRLAPGDDRVWLGKAHLAIRRGDRDEAARWLDECRRRRPEDPAVRAALDRLAAIAGRPNRAAEPRRRADEAGRAEERYRQLLRRDQTLRDAAELSRLADRLGHRFEARAFRVVAAGHGRRFPMD